MRRELCVVRGLRFGDLVLAVRGRTVDHAALAVAPVHLNGHVRRGPRGEGQRRVGAREVQPAGDDLSVLERDRTSEHTHAAADPSGIGRGPAQPHRDARRGGVVAKHGRRLAEAIDHHIEIAVAVEIGDRHAMRDVVAEIEMPGFARVLERQVPAIAERDIGKRQGRIFEQHVAPVDDSQLRPETVLGVAVHDVADVTRADEDVLPAVQVDVHEQRGPRPPRPAYARVAGHLGEGAVAAVQLERVALQLGPLRADPGMLGGRGVRGDLHLEAARILAQHIHLKEIGVAVAIDVADGNRHPRITRGPQSVPGNQPKPAVAVVQPQLVGVFEIVRHIQIRCAVARDIGEDGGEAEILALLGERLPLLVAKPRVPRDRLALEMPPPIVQVEEIWIRALLQADATEIGAVDQLVIAAIGLPHFVAVGTEAPRHAIERPLLWREAIQRRVCLVVRDVQIQIAVTVHIGEGDAHAPSGGTQTCGVLAEVSAAIVYEDRVGAAARNEDQVGIPVAIHIGERAPGGIAVGRGHAGARGDFLEVPVTEIAIQRVRAFGAGKEDVRPPVAIHIGEADAGALGERAVLQQQRIADGIGECDPRALRVEQGKPRCMCGRDREIAPTIAVDVMPRGVGGRALRRAAGSREDRGESKNAVNRLPQSSGGAPLRASTRYADRAAP